MIGHLRMAVCTLAALLYFVFVVFFIFQFGDKLGLF